VDKYGSNLYFFDFEAISRNGSGSEKTVFRRALNFLAIMNID